MRSDSTATTFIEQTRRAQLADVATALLAREGFAGASIAAVAREAGVSKGVVLYHFDAKAQLLNAVVERANGAAEAFMIARLQQAVDGPGRLRVYIESNLDFFAECRELMVALVEVVVHTPPPNPYAPLRTQALAGLRELIEHGQRAGEFADTPAEVSATAIRGAIDAVAGRLRDEPELDPRPYGRALADLFVGAIAR